MLVILLVTVAFGVSYNQDDMFLKTFTNEFDTTINIVSSPERTQNNRTKLQELAQKHNMSFIKVRRIPRNQRNERQQISIFVYLNEAAWFEKAFPNISFQRNIHGTNEFKNAKGATFLTSKEVSLLPFSKINSNNFNGDYYFRGTKEDTEAFLQELSGDENLGIQATVDSSAAVASDITENQLFLYLTILAIMVAAIFFCYAIYNGQLTKELAVAGLIGWKSTHFAATKAARLVIPPLLIAVPIISGALMYVMQLQTVRGFLSATKSGGSRIFLHSGICNYRMEVQTVWHNAGAKRQAAESRENGNRNEDCNLCGNPAAGSGNDCRVSGFQGCGAAYAGMAQICELCQYFLRVAVDVRRG